MSLRTLKVGDPIFVVTPSGRREVPPQTRTGVVTKLGSKYLYATYGAWVNQFSFANGRANGHLAPSAYVSREAWEHEVAEEARREKTYQKLRRIGHNAVLTALTTDEHDQLDALLDKIIGAKP